MIWIWYNISCRRINTNPLISEWIWADTNNEGYKQKVLSQILSQLGPGGWRGETIFQTTGEDHLQITVAPFSSWMSRIIKKKNDQNQMLLYFVYSFFFGFKNLKMTICVKTFQGRIMTSIFFSRVFPVCLYLPFLDHALICSVVKADTKKVLCIWLKLLLCLWSLINKKRHHVIL